MRKEMLSNNATRPKFVISNNSRPSPGEIIYLFGLRLIKYANRHECEIHLTLQNTCYKKYILENIVERGSSVVECRTRNRERERERAHVRIPFAIVSKFGYFRSRHDACRLCINEKAPTWL